jgi:hypothetical protein
MTNFIIDLDEYAEGAIILNGFEDCIVGVVEEFGNGRRILYSKSKILNKLCKRDLMTTEEAEEFYDYNILGLYAGEQNAVFLDVEILPEILNEEIIYKVK